MCSDFTNLSTPQYFSPILWGRFLLATDLGLEPKRPFGLLRVFKTRPLPIRVNLPYPSLTTNVVREILFLFNYTNKRTNKAQRQFAFLVSFVTYATTPQIATSTIAFVIIASISYLF